MFFFSFEFEHHTQVYTKPSFVTISQVQIILTTQCMVFKV